MFKCFDKVLYQGDTYEIRAVTYGHSQNKQYGRIYTLYNAEYTVEKAAECDIKLAPTISQLSPTVALVVSNG